MCYPPTLIVNRQTTLLELNNNSKSVIIVANKNKDIQRKVFRMEKKMKSKIMMLVIGGMAVAVLLIILIVSLPKVGDAEVVTKSTLEKIVNISELSTYEAVYNGIAVVYNEKKVDKIDYYVSYDAKVKAGIDVEMIEFEVDQVNKTLVVDIPEVQINDVVVDMTTMEYMFVNDKENTSGVSEVAYKACIKDVENESAQKEAIKLLAEESAKNIIKALVEPFIEQLDESYTLEIK